jgi:hypothetical protein
MTKHPPRVPEHRPIAHVDRAGEIKIETHVVGGHRIWVAVDDVGVVALAGSEDALHHVLAEGAG